MSARSSGENDRRGLGLLLLAIAFVAGSTHVTSLQTTGIDFFQYWLVADETRRSTEDLYSPETRTRWAREAQSAAFGSPDARLVGATRARAGGIEIFSTPFLYTVFRPLSTGDYERDLRRYQILSLLAGIAAMLLLARALGLGVRETTVFLLLVPIFEPYGSEVAVANVNRLQLLALAGFLALSGSDRPLRTIAAGSVLGFIGLMKPNVAFAVGLLFASRLLDRQFRTLALEAAGAAGACAVGIVVSAVAMGSVTLWLEWPGAVAELFTSFDAIPVEASNFAAVQLVREALGVDPGPWIWLLLLAVLGGTVYAARRPPGAGDAGRARDAVILGIGCAAMLVASRLAWKHYFLMDLLLFMAVLAGPGVGPTARVRRGVAILGLLLVSLVPVRSAEITSMNVAAWTVVSGNLLLLLSGVWALLSPMDSPKEPDPSIGARATEGP